MASRSTALEEEAAAPEEEEAASYLDLEEEESDMPRRRRARNDEQTVLCLGKTKCGERCARPRREVFCVEHVEQWTWLTDEFKASLRTLAAARDALDPGVWDAQFRFVSDFYAHIENAEAVTGAAAAAEAGANAVLDARAESDNAVRDGMERIAGASHARHTRSG